MSQISAFTIQVLLLLVIQTCHITCQITSTRDSEEAFCENSCQNVTTAKCKCDRYCSVQKDCCMDSRYKGRSRTRAKIECLPQQQLDAVYTITNCKRRWRGPQGVIDNCTLITNIAIDPLGFIPVTNIQSGTTYKNKYCAMCNGISSFVPWNVRFSCPISNWTVSTNEALENLVFDPVIQKWGLLMENNEPEFLSCDLKPEIPTFLQDKVRWCYGETVSTCVSDWENITAKRKCEEYLDPVKDQQMTYRNYHCAICNRIPPSQLTCLTVTYRPNPYGLQGANFAMLMDFSNDGCVGDNGQCPCDKAWDPFFQKCRTIVNF